jgi:stringent starvation protein B
VAVRSKRPYLIRALNDWIVDSELTPYLMVDATGDEVQVPAEFVSDGRIVLNISPAAVRDLVIGDDAVAFSARFGGRPFSVYVPTGQVLAVYAQETNEGMMFEPEQESAPSSGHDAASTSDSAADADSLSTSGDRKAADAPSASKPGSHLKLVE